MQTQYVMLSQVSTTAMLINMLPWTCSHLTLTEM